MSRRALWVLIVLMVITRVPMAWLAIDPPLYEHDGINTSSDVFLYEGWANAMIEDAQGAYSRVQIEYPPGSLPFILAPKIMPGEENYLDLFVVMMILIDIAAFVGLFLIARRWGSWWGLALWVLALPALGPIAYLRLDLVPAVATIWALERASTKDWLGAGGWMGVGAIAKLYPLLFLPAGIVLVPQRRRFAIAAAIVFAAPLIPLIPSFDGLLNSVFGYHADRGIQVESLWGGILFLAQKAGSDPTLFLGYSFKALHFDGDLAQTLKTAGTIASMVVVGVGVLLALRLKGRDPAKAYAEVCFVTLALSLTTGTVFSPQFMVWLIALAGAVGCIFDSKLRPFIFVLVPIGALSQSVFPFLYNDLLIAENFPVLLLWIRNSLVGILGIAAALRLWFGYRKGVSAPSIPEPASG